jgi:hypothetical protein
MGLLQIKLNAAVEKDWAEVRSRPEFTYMPQIGVLSALIRSYLTHSMSPDEKERAASVAKDVVPFAERRIMGIKRWAKMSIEMRMGNTLEYMQYADPALVERFGDEFAALNQEAMQYE